MVKRVVLGLVGSLCLSVWALGQSCAIQVYFVSPEAGNNARTAIVQSIDGARDSLEIAVSSFTDDLLGDAVVRAHLRGVDVRVVLAGGREGEIGSEYEKLLAAGVPVRLSDGSGPFGHRFAVIDRRIVLTGSYEWTDRTAATPFDSLTRITCPTAAQAAPAMAFVAEFDRLWGAWRESTSAALPAASAVSSVSILSVDRTAQCIYLLNASDRAIDLSYWSLNDLEGQYTFPLGTVIPSNDPYRICIDVFNPTGDIDELYLDPDGDELFLATPEGRIVDELVW